MSASLNSMTNNNIAVCLLFIACSLLYQMYEYVRIFNWSFYSELTPPAATVASASYISLNTQNVNNCRPRRFVHFALQIGSCPGLTAAYLGHHYAGPGNHFCEYTWLSPFNYLFKIWFILHLPCWENAVLVHLYVLMTLAVTRFVKFVQCAQVDSIDANEGTVVMGWPRSTHP